MAQGPPSPSRRRDYAAYAYNLHSTYHAAGRPGGQNKIPNATHYITPFPLVLTSPQLPPRSPKLADQLAYYERAQLAPNKALTKHRQLPT